MKRRVVEPRTRAAAAQPAPAVHSALAQRVIGPPTREEVEERYITARDAWTNAMRAANSGRSVDLASLALAQETYEMATAERERWIAGGPVAIPIKAEDPRRDIQAAIGQEMAWRKVKHHEKPVGFLGRLKRRITGR